MVAGKSIFEGGFKFVASEARKKVDSTTLAYQGAIGKIILPKILFLEIFLVQLNQVSAKFYICNF